jgi:hypothetical protein
MSACFRVFSACPIEDVRLRSAQVTVVRARTLEKHEEIVVIDGVGFA